MIPKECKRLSEVDFPIAEVSKHSAREKSIRHGHPSTLHLWWARRPLAACRAMLLELLLPDPCDENCPKDFKKKARDLLPRLIGKVGPKDEDLRKSLLKFVADFANWDNSSHPTFLEVGRGLVKAAHGEETPLVVDPFAGGGSIPLEALRLGCDAFASDLNPVACLILKVMLEDIPRHGPELADDLRRVGKEIKEKAEKELAEFYPKDKDGATPIAYLWARTVKCESPNCGAEIPLMRSFWLCKKSSRKRALKYKVIRPKGQPPRVEFDIFEPKTEKEVPGGTVTRAKATCLCCNMVLSPERVRAQLAEQRGGADVIFKAKGKRQKAKVEIERVGGARLLAVVTLRSGERGRHYRLPTERDYQAIWNVQKRLKEILDEWERGGRKGLCPVPDEHVDEWHHDVNRLPMYGMGTWGKIHTTRQKVLLLTIREAWAGRLDKNEILALVTNKLADKSTSFCRWKTSAEYMAGNTFSRQALGLVWDFCEAQPFAGVSGGWQEEIEWIAKVIESVGRIQHGGQVQQSDAVASPLPDESSCVWFTDPPYYDAIDYAHCSDFFFCWLKRNLPKHPLLLDPYDPLNVLTPKTKEIVVDSTTTKGHGVRTPRFYEESMAKAFSEGRRLLREGGIGCVVFAHKTTEGWEALLSGMITGGWVITGSWPIATESSSRLRAMDSAALATSVHLVCRPHPEDAPVGDWMDVLRELPKRVGDWMERLQGEGIRGADLVFACIGPALEIFSRYRKVETADGSEVTLAQYLEKVWDVVGRLALEQVLGTAEAKARNGAAGAVEEDARLTALFLWTLQSTNGETSNGDAEAENEEDEDAAPRGKPKGYSLVFDVARRFAQPLGIDLPKWEGRIIETKKGVVRLMTVSERAKQLFGEDGADAAADWIAHDPQKNLQRVLFPEMEEECVPKVHGRRRKAIMDTSDVDFKKNREATTLDRVHAAMLLQSGGQANALRALIKAEQDRGPDFLRLANALSALYPKSSEEKRLLDAMLLAIPR
jgi:putative DNA methylase